MIDNIEVIAQSAIKITDNGKIIYFDPYMIKDDYHDADIIFITHPHYDHFSVEDILKVKKETTKIVVTTDLEENVNKLGFEDVLTVEPNKKYIFDNISFDTVPAYNINKNFHKKEYNWVGYILNINNKKIYVAGDTDDIPEIRNIKPNIALVPIGGTYTMNWSEAVNLIKKIKPSIAIPIHYKTIVGTIDDANNFKEKLNGISEVKILME